MFAQCLFAVCKLREHCKFISVHLYLIMHISCFKFLNRALWNVPWIDVKRRLTNTVVVVSVKYNLCLTRSSFLPCQFILAAFRTSDRHMTLKCWSHCKRATFIGKVLRHVLHLNLCIMKWNNEDIQLSALDFFIRIRSSKVCDDGAL
jgi:hypothetical protein